MPVSDDWSWQLIGIGNLANILLLTSWKPSKLSTLFLSVRALKTGHSAIPFFAQNGPGHFPLVRAVHFWNSNGDRNFLMGSWNFFRPGPNRRTYEYSNHRQPRLWKLPKGTSTYPSHSQRNLCCWSIWWWNKQHRDRYLRRCRSVSSLCFMAII